MVDLQGAKLITGTGDDAVDAFTTSLGRRAGGAAATFLADWIERVAATNGAPGASQTLTDELSAQPQATQQLRTEISARLDVALPPLATPSKPLPTNAVVVDAYAAVYWRLAYAAYVETRPIAIPGALQGGSWVTVVVPQAGLGLAADKPPKVEEVWQRYDPTMLQRPSMWERADIYVKPGDPTSEVPALERRFRNADSRRPVPFPPDEQPDDLAARWHRLEGVGALWAQLQPDSAARRWMIEHGVRDSDDLDHPAHDMYPPEWHPLMDIPDEIAAVTTLDRAADEFTAKSNALRQAIMARMQQPDP